MIEKVFRGININLLKEMVLRLRGLHIGLNLLIFCLLIGLSAGVKAGTNVGEETVDKQVTESMKSMKSLKKFYKNLAVMTSRGGRKIAKNEKHVTALSTCMKKYAFKEGSQFSGRLEKCMKNMRNDSIDAWYLNSCIYKGLKEVEIHKRSIKYTQNPSYLALVAAGLNKHCWMNDYFFQYEKYERESKEMLSLFGY